MTLYAMSNRPCFRVLKAQRLNRTQEVAGVTSLRVESALGDSRRLPAFTLRRGIAYQEMMVRWLDELTEFVEVPA
jgi:Virulence activator alpha C-term